MADEVSAIDAEMRGRSFNGLNQKVDGDRLLRRQRPAGSGQIWPHDAKAGKRRQHRLKAIGRAAKTVQQDERWTFPVRIDHHASDLD